MRKPDLNLKKKLHSKAGETIAETLVTMIVLSLAVLMLAGAVVTAARVNKQADNTDTSFQTGKPVPTGTDPAKVIISEENATGGTGSTVAEFPVTLYQSQNQSQNSSGKSYIYYKAQ